MVRQLHALLPLGLLLAGCWAYTDDDAQYIKGVKGGHGGRWSQGASLYRPSQNGSEFGYGTSYGLRQNLTAQVEEIGVCYIEVPTASLARDRSHLPAGNGSRSDLSRIRTCCKGYERNIHNYRKCDPICTTECVNALCSAPETCTCYPDHVKNLAGFCVATCPIGCQNGHCDGGECLCKEGYQLDIDGKYCVPHCKDNCGGVGNCTAPNVCECKKEGFHTTSDGSCRATCERCTHGDCVAPNQCRCRQGYDMDQNGDCIPQCYQTCGPNGRCVAPNVCEFPPTTRRPDLPNSFPQRYPSEYVTQYPDRQPQYPASQQTYNHSSPQQPSHTQGYPSGSAQYPINSESSQYPFNSQQHLYPQFNSSGGTYYPVNTQQPSYSQYPSQYPLNPQSPQHSPQNSSAPVQYPLYPQLPPHTQYPTGYQQYNSSESLHQSQSQQQSSNSEYVSGSSQYGYNTQQIYSSAVPSQQRPQSSSHTQYIPSGPEKPSNSYPSPYHQSHNPSNSPNTQVYPIDQTLEFDTPQCARPCINATCVEGNRCACNPGYVPDRSDYTESRCEPYCPGGCQNGVCIAPYSCACIEGYHMETHGVKGARARCVRRERRSLNRENKQRSEREISVADLLVYMIPDYD